MSNLIKIDFRKEQRRDTAAYRSFERAMYEHERRERFKTAWLMVSFSLVVIGIASTPFIFDYLRTH